MLTLGGGVQQAAAAEGFTKQVSRKVGRPVTFQGDINSPSLTSSERSRLKRRVVNRAAARRLRERQQDTLDGAHLKVSQPTLLCRCAALC